MKRASVLVVLPMMAAGCMPLPTSRPEGQPAMEQADGPINAAVAVEGETIEITAKVELRCRNVTPYAVWQPCGSKPASHAPVVIFLAGGTKLNGRTDATGAATISLAGVMSAPELLDKPTAMVSVVGAGTPINLRGTGAYARWERELNEVAAPVAVEPAPARDRRAVAGEVRDSALAKLRGLQAAEKTLSALGPPWTDQKIDAAKFTLNALGEAEPATAEELGAMSDSERKEFMDRGHKIQSWMDRMMPALRKAAEARIKRIDRGMEGAMKGAEAACAKRCLVSAVNATREHCQAVCEQNPFRSF